MSLSVLIMTYNNRPLLRATYEVIHYIHLAFGKSFSTLAGIEPGPSDRHIDHSANLIV